MLGVVAFDALTSAGRALLAGAEDVAEKLAAALPEPVRTVLVQADLTVVAPGRLVPELAEELAVVAEIESAGFGDGLPGDAGQRPPGAGPRPLRRRAAPAVRRRTRRPRSRRR